MALRPDALHIVTRVVLAGFLLLQALPFLELPFYLHIGHRTFIL